MFVNLLRHSLSPPEVAGLVQVEALVPGPLDQGPLAPLLLPHRGVETAGVGIIVTIAIRVGLKQRQDILKWNDDELSSQFKVQKYSVLIPA